jgi:hypothetical protein
MSESSGQGPPDGPDLSKPERPGGTEPPPPHQEPSPPESAAPYAPPPPAYPPPVPGPPGAPVTGPVGPPGAGAPPAAPGPYGPPPSGTYGAPPPGGYQAYGQYPARRANSKATISLVCGIASIALACFPLGIPGLITGFSARREIRDANGAETGDGLAVAGIVLSLIGLLVVGCFVGSILAVTLLGSNATSKFSSIGSAIR